MLDTYEQNSKKKLVATIIAVVVIAGVVVLADVFKSKSSTADSTAAQTTTQTAPTDSSATDTTAASTATDTSGSTTTGSYKDGTYSASSSYDVPAGTESIKVTATISGGTITDVSIVNSESDHDSAEYQADFTDSYKTAVVGKKISGLQISSVAGASDTTEGFNEALTKIASEAQA
jgi:uncharacterized protein with FMN-binding domain